MREPQEHSVAPAVFIVSASTFLLQIGLTRVFAYTIWYHFAFLVIAAALLGYGASGSALMLWKRSKLASSDDLIGLLALGAALTTALTSVWITRVPLDPFRMHRDWTEGVRFVSYLCAVTIPFVFAGGTVGVALSRFPAAAGRLYFADLAGAACACASVVALVDFMGPRRLLVVCVLLDVVAAVVAAKPRRREFAAVGFLAVIVATANAWFGDFTPAQSKLASKYRSAGGEVAYSRWSAVFRTDMYDFHDAMSLSSDPSLTVYGIGVGGVGKTFAGRFPPYRFISHDGDASAVMVRNRPGDDTGDLLRHHLLGLSYRFKPGAKVFMGGVGGGIDVVSALAGGAASVHGVELDPNTVDIVCRAHSDYVGDVCRKPNVVIEAGDARSVLRHGDEKYDIVNFTSVDTITSAATGAYLLSEGYLYTVEAMSDYLDHTKPNGIVSIISGDLGGPWGLPRWIPRITSVAASALERRGITAPEDHVVVLGTTMPDGAGLSHEAVFVKAQPFAADELEFLDNVANEEGLVFWHRPHKAIQTAASHLLRLDPKGRSRYEAGLYLDYSAPTDDKPFFMHFYKWGSLFKHAKFDTRYVEATGNFVLLAGLAFAVIGAATLIAAPAFVAARRSGRRTGRAKMVGYFATIGVAFMFIEMALVQRLVLLLGYPTYSLTVTLFALLAFAALGSFLTRNVAPVRRHAAYVAAALTALGVGHFFLDAAIERALLPAPLALRAVAAVLLLAPLGVLLGVFLPSGIRALGRRDSDAIPLAWAANGTMSVVGTVLAVILGTVMGFRGVLGIALGLYWVAVMLFPEEGRSESGGDMTAAG
jgi:hypothetical protein